MVFTTSIRGFVQITNHTMHLSMVRTYLGGTITYTAWIEFERNITSQPSCFVPIKSKSSTSAETLFDSSHILTDVFSDRTDSISSTLGWRTTIDINRQRLAGLLMAETCASLVSVESMIKPILKCGSSDASCQLGDPQYFFEFDEISMARFVTTFASELGRRNSFSLTREGSSDDSCCIKALFWMFGTMIPVRSRNTGDFVLLQYKSMKRFLQSRLNSLDQDRLSQIQNSFA